MKKYRLQLISDPSLDSKELHIFNEDSDPVIKEIIFDISYLGDGRTYNRSIDVQFSAEKETQEMKNEFEKTDNGYKSLVLGKEHLSTFDESTEDFSTFLKIIQTIDPIPLHTIREINNKLPGYGLNIPYTLELEEMLEEGKHEAALEFALHTFENGEPGVLSLLAEIYKKKEDQTNYLNVLGHLPGNHPDFSSSNEIILSHLFSLEIPEDEDEQQELLENKFRASVNSEQSELSGNLFHQLCGNSGLSPAVRHVKGDADTLIHIAQEMKELTRKLAQLEAVQHKDALCSPKQNNAAEAPAEDAGMKVKNPPTREDKSTFFSQPQALHTEIMHAKELTESGHNKHKH